MSSNLDILKSHSSILNKPKTTTLMEQATGPQISAPKPTAVKPSAPTPVNTKPLFQGRTNDPVEVARNRALEQAQKERDAFTRLRSRAVDDMELYRTDPNERKKANLRYQSYTDKIAAADDVIRRATEGIGKDWETEKAAEIKAAGGDELLRRLVQMDELEAQKIKDATARGDERRTGLTENERTYNAMKQELRMLYGDKVDGWLEYVDRTRNKKQTEATLAKTAEKAKDSKVGMSAASVLTNKLAGAGYVDVLGQKLQRGATGSNAPIDYNSPAQLPSKVTNTIRSTVSEDMGGVGSFLYNTGMSMADSLTSMPMGKAGMVLLGGSAATNAMQEAAKRGATDNQALAMGLVAGVSEALLEKASVDRLFNMKQADTAKDAILNVLKQMGAEGTEEGLTNIANTIADAVVMGDKSEYETAKQAYMADGKTAEQAELKAFTDWVTNFFLDVGGGMISGGVMGGGKSGIDYLRNNRGGKRTTVDSTMPAIPQAEQQTQPAQPTAPVTPTVDNVMPKAQPEQAVKPDNTNITPTTEQIVRPDEQNRTEEVKKPAMGAVGDMGAKTSDFRHETKESQSKTTPRYYEQHNVPQEGQASSEYTVVHRDESLHNAKARLEQDYEGEVEYLSGKTTWSDEEMLEADLILRRLRNEAEQSGDWSEHRKWAKTFGEHKTEAGRALGILGMLSEETGDTILEDAAISLETAKKGTDADAVMQTVSELATEFDMAVADRSVDELVSIIKKTANNRKTGFYSGKLGKLTSLHLDWAINRIANYAKSGIKISESPQTAKAFKVGDVVSPSDRGNFGKVTKINDDGTYEVHFVAKTGHEATKTFAASELTSPKGKSITASDISTNPNAAFEFLKNFAAAGVKNIAADTNRASVLDMAKSIRRNAMLSKFSTIARNLVGNTAFDIADTVARDISVPLDTLLSTITGTRSVAADYGIASKAKRQGAMDGLAMALLETSLDVNARDQKSKYEGGSQRTFKMSGNIVSKVLSTWEGLMGYGLYVPDEIAKGGTGAEVQRGLNKLYEAGKIQEGDESLRSGGAQEALYRTFQDETVFSKAAVGVRDATGVVGEAILPFAQVPANLADRAIDYSPAGIAETAARLGNVIVKAKKGTLTAAEQAAAVQNLGRNITGSALIALAFTMAAKGIIRVANPGGEDENKDKAASEKSQGLNGTQWNVSSMLRSIAGKDSAWKDGDDLLSIAFAEPFNAHLTIGALLAEDAKEEDGLTFAKLAKDSFTGSLAAILDMPLFESAKNVYDAYRYSDKERAGEKVMDAAITLGAEYAGSFIPNAWKGVAQGLDKYQRDLYSKDTAIEQLGDQIKGVFNRDALPIKQDPYGNDMENPGGIQNFLNANILPGAITKYTDTDLTNALNKLSEETGKSSMYLSKDAPKSITVDDEKIELTDNQKQQFMSDRGDIYEEVSAALENNSYYQGFSDEWKLKAYNYAEDYATQAAKNNLGVGFKPDSWVSDLDGATEGDLSEALVERVVKNIAEKTGANTYLGLGEMLSDKSIDEQLAAACLGATSQTAYGAYEANCVPAGVNVSQFLDAYGTARAADKNNGDIQKQAALDYIEKMDLTPEQKGALASAVFSAIGKTVRIDSPVSEQWLLDTGDINRLEIQMGRDQEKQPERYVAYEKYIKDSSVDMQTYLDFYNFQKSDEAEGDNRQDKIIDWLEKLDAPDEVKGRLFCTVYKRTSCPLKWRTDVPRD